MNVYDKIEELKSDNDIIAIKVWTYEDIASVMECCGITPNAENIRICLDYLNVSSLEEETERERDILYEAVSRGIGKYED